MIGGVPTMPFSMVALPPLGSPNARLSDALKQLSAAKYGRPRAVVEEEFNNRMAVPTPVVSTAAEPSTPTAQPASPTQSPQLSPAPQPVAAAGGGGSFLDDWLKKRTAPPATATPTAQPASPTQSPQLSPAPQPVAAAPTGTQNISSDEIEQSEVTKIAAELKQELNNPSKPAPKNEASVSLRSSDKNDTAKAGDIIIDRDGSFHVAD